MNPYYPTLFSPCKIGNVTIKNRICKAPQTTGLSHMDGSVSSRLVRCYEDLARGEVGMVIVEYAYVDRDCSKSASNQLGICDDEYIVGLGWLADTLKNLDCVPCIQIEHCGRQRFLGPPMKSASPNPWPLMYQRYGRAAIPAELTLDEIDQLVEDFGKAALRAKTAGFEVVEIHGAHGYLITNFLSPFTNQRRDWYGGSRENRFRFLEQVFTRCKEYVGEDFPIIVRMSIDEYLGDAGRGEEESKILCQWMERDGVAAIDAEAAVFETVEWMIPTIYQPKATLAHLAAAIKEAVSIPVFAQGRMFDPEVAEQVLADGQADFISESREWIVEPDFVTKLEKGDVEGIRRCINCNYCIGKRIFGQMPLRCTFNPIAGRESRFPNGKVGKAEEKKRVAIIGAGPAGLEAAYIAAQRGHSVEVYEATDRLCGGQLRIASSSPCKDILQHIPDFFRVQLGRLPNVKIHLNSPVTAENAASIEADTVLVCTGAEPLVPNIPGIDGANVKKAQDVLLGKAEVKGDVVICGGGQVGVETALELIERGHKITIVEMLPDLILKEELMTRIVMMKKLAAAGVNILCSHSVTAFTDSGVEVEDMKTRSFSRTRK